LLKHFTLFFIISLLALNANNFGDGILAFKKGHYSQAKTSFEKSVKKGETTHSYYMLGRMYLHGKGVGVNLKKAIKFLSYAYKMGNIPAGCYLSEAHIKDGVNVYLAAEGVKRGMAINLPYCEKIFIMWRAYNSDITTFSKALRQKFLDSHQANRVNR